MQPEVTVALATIWLLVSLLGGTGGAAATLHPSPYLTPDQYSPLPPRHPQVYQTVAGQLDSNDQENRRQDQPFDLSIGPRTSLDEAPRDLLQARYPAREFNRRPEDQSDNFSPLKLEGTKQGENWAGSKSEGERVGNGATKAENQESFSSEGSPPGAEDPFVADDTFQDQGPGSVEIYKLDLVKEKALLSPSSTTKSPIKNKSKLPKKTSHVNWKAKTSELKTTSPKIVHRQSNFFDELPTDIPPNSESFGVGGVPELQVGCEGLEASSHKLKRSIDSLAKEKTPRSEGNPPLADVTPISIDLEYELSSEDTYEEMDELLKLKKLESTTKKPKQNRGDMDATLHDNEFFGDIKTDKLPVRGDLGKSSTASDSNLQPPAPLTKNCTSEKGVSRYANKARKLLWAEDPSNEKSGGKRNKRSDWGYGEEEGVLSSDELQTENQRRRQHDERLRMEDARRREQARNQSQTQIHDIREEYEKMLEERRREEEARRHRLEQGASQRTPSTRWREEEERRREHEEHLRRMRYNNPGRNYQTTEQPHHTNRNYQPRQRLLEEQEKQREQQRMEAERRRQEYEETRRRYEEERRLEMKLREEEARIARARYDKEQQRPTEEEHKRQLEEEHRRREQNRSQEGTQRRGHEQQEDRQRSYQHRQRNLSAEERRSLEERRREWMQKEEERRRQESTRQQAPSNLIYSQRTAANESRQRDPETERRMRENAEREREWKLRQYIQRNQPINVNRSNGSPEAERREDSYRNMTDRRVLEEEQRRRAEEERRRQLEEDRRSEEYARRKQSSGSGTGERRVPGEVRSYDYFRHPGTENERRAHGPSAPVHSSNSRSYGEDARRRQEARRVEDERERRVEAELRTEMLRREEAMRRIQSRRYEEERKRQESLRQEAERRRKELLEEQARRSHAGRNRPVVENRRPEYEDHRFQEFRRRQETSLIPGNLVLDEARRTEERERQRQEQERRRHEAERRRQEEDRVKEARQKEEHDRAMREQLRRHEEARLNALPVSARIIVRPVAPTASPKVTLQTRFGNDIDFLGLNPYGQGVPASKFPAPPTKSPPMESPAPCVWAVVQCCPTNRNRLVTCFESLGCPGINWDPNPCRTSIAKAARDQVARFYAAAEKEEYS